MHADVGMDVGDLCGASKSEIQRRENLERLAATIPATALRFTFCQFIARHLDADDNLRCQDWRGFADMVSTCTVMRFCMNVQCCLQHVSTCMRLLLNSTSGRELTLVL